MRYGQGEDLSDQPPLQWSNPHRIEPVGIPLGSACSPAIGECILAQFLRDVPNDRYIAYADNILLFGTDETEVQVLTENIQETVHAGISAMRYRAGEVLRMHAVGEMSSGFEFLSQYASMLRGDSSGFVWRSNTRKVAEHGIEEWLPEADHTELDETEAKVINWRRAYPEWPEGNETEAQYLAEIACLRHFQSPSSLHKRRTIAVVITAIAASNFVGDPEYFVPDITVYAQPRRRLIDACQRWLSEALERDTQTS